MLNAKKATGGGAKKNFVEQPVLEAGTYPARLVSVIDLGLQQQRPYKGEEKKPAHMIQITMELVDEFLVDEEGNDLEDKPRWLSEEFPLYNLTAARAKSTQRYYALDPDEVHEGDWTALLGAPANVLLITNTVKSGPNQGKERNYIKDLSAMRPKDSRKTPDLVNEAKFFSLDEPDLEVFLSLPDFLQEKIKGNLEYNGSVLQGLLEVDKEEPKAKPQPKKEKPVEEPEEPSEDDDEEEERPW